MWNILTYWFYVEKVISILIVQFWNLVNVLAAKSVQYETESVKSRIEFNTAKLKRPPSGVVISKENWVYVEWKESQGEYCDVCKPYEM